MIWHSRDRASGTEWTLEHGAWQACVYGNGDDWHGRAWDERGDAYECDRATADEARSAVEAFLARMESV